MKWEKYLYDKEDKRRRKCIKNADKGPWFSDDSRAGFRRTMVHYKSRQGINIHIRSNGVKEMYEKNRSLIAILNLFISVWASGFLAHAGMKFESLLVVVVGFILVAIIVSGRADG